MPDPNRVGDDDLRAVFYGIDWGKTPDETAIVFTRKSDGEAVEVLAYLNGPAAHFVATALERLAAQGDQLDQANAAGLVEAGYGPDLVDDNNRLRLEVSDLQAQLAAARQSLEAAERLKGIARDYKKHLDDECAEHGCLCTMRGAVPCSAWIDEAINGRP